MKRLVTQVLCLVLAVTLARASEPKELPRGIPDGLGVSVHWRGKLDDSHAVVEPIEQSFLEQQIQQIKSAGLKLVRTDIAWRWTDRAKHEYDFAPHERLIDLCDSQGLRLMTILSFRDLRYEEHFSVRSDEGRKAYADFCAAAAEKFKGRGIIWEMWNEPNLAGFWNPRADAAEYAAAVTQAIAAMRQADPDCLIIAPSTCTFDFSFLESCFEKGLLDVVSALSLHPYCDAPESVFPRQLQLRNLVNRYRPDQAALPIVTSEWGFSRVFVGTDKRIRSEEEQAALVVRSILVDQMCGVQTHVIYTNRDYTDKLEWNEDSFGFVTFDGKPKVSHGAIATLVRMLGGMTFDRQLLAGSVERFESPASDYAAMFTDGKRRIVVLWSTQPEHETLVQLPGRPIAAWDMLGREHLIPSLLDASGPAPLKMAKTIIAPAPIYIEIELN